MTEAQAAQPQPVSVRSIERAGSRPARFVGTSVGPVRYVQAGEGPDVVLVHGAMTCLEDMMLGPFEQLARHFRVTAFDRPGHGQTPRRRLDGAPSQQAHQLLAALDALDVARAVVVGQSFGAALAMELALFAPDRTRGVLAISPIAFAELRIEHLLYGPRAWPGIGDWIALAPGRLQDAVLLPLLWPAIFAPQQMPERFARQFPFALSGNAENMLALGEEAILSLPDLAWASRCYPLLRPPIVIMAGLSDWVAPPWTHAALLASLAPDATLQLLPGQGHMLHHFAIDAVVANVAALARRS